MSLSILSLLLAGCCPARPSFRPSLRLEEVNTSALMLPVREGSRGWRRGEQLEEQWEEEELEARIARVQRLLALEAGGRPVSGEEERLYRGQEELFRGQEELYRGQEELYRGHEELYSVGEYEEEYSDFVPSLPLPPPSSPKVRDVRIVVKSLPGAGPRLTGPTHSPPKRRQHLTSTQWIPEQWDTETVCDETIPPSCVATVPGFPGCLEDETYPRTSLQLALYRDALLLRKWVEQPSAREPWDGNPDYGGYSTGYSREHWDSYPGFLCPSQVEFVRPLRLRNTEGAWRVVVNSVHVYSQTVRIENCLVEAGPCRLLPPCYSATCTQLHSFHRLLAFNPCRPGDGVFVDTFRLPSACSCSLPV